MTQDRPKTASRRSYVGSFFASFFASIFDRFLVRFWSHLGGFWEPKSVIFGIDFLMIFACCSKSGPRAAKSLPRASQERPRASQERPRELQERQKVTQEGPKSGKK